MTDTIMFSPSPRHYFELETNNGHVKLYAHNHDIRTRSAAACGRGSMRETDGECGSLSIIPAYNRCPECGLIFQFERLLHSCPYCEHRLV